MNNKRKKYHNESTDDRENEQPGIVFIAFKKLYAQNKNNVPGKNQDVCRK